MAEKHEEAAKNVSRSAEKFTVNFHKNLAGGTDGNFVSSALSAHVVLSMAAYGAGGTTAKEMKQALHLPENDTLAHQGFQSFIDTLNDVPNVVLKLANKIYAAHNISLKDKFVEITKTYFRSESERLDFSKSAEAAKTVNQWCVDKTNGKIKDLLTANDVNASTRMILLNAVYFKGSWKHKFDEKRTEMKPFHVNKTTTIKVPTMHITKKFFYEELEDLNAECVGLPYENEDLAMIIIIPKEIDGLTDIEKNLEKIELDYEKKLKYHKREIQLALPKFKVETTIDLKVHLNELGMTEMFKDSANFTGIADELLKVDKVLQKAFIEVNEEGSEAAAVTGVTMVFFSGPLPPQIMNVDKPFLYKIIYKNSTLFSGSVVNPLKN